MHGTTSLKTNWVKVMTRMMMMIMIIITSVIKVITRMMMMIMIIIAMVIRTCV